MKMSRLCIYCVVKVKVVAEKELHASPVKTLAADPAEASPSGIPSALLSCPNPQA